MLQKVADALTALRQYLHQIHLCSHNKDYDGHSLADRLIKPLSDDIDRLKEVSLGLGEDLSIAYATESLDAASTLLQDYPQGTDTQAMWRACKQFEMKTCELIEAAAEFYTHKRAFGRQGILNALGDISEKRIRDIYLIDIQLLGKNEREI